MGRHHKRLSPEPQLVDVPNFMRRTALLCEELISRLETARTTGGDLPRGYSTELKDLVAALDKLSLAQARVMKADQDYWASLDIRERLEAFAGYLFDEVYPMHSDDVEDYLRDLFRRLEKAREAATEARIARMKD